MKHIAFTGTQKGMTQKQKQGFLDSMDSLFDVNTIPIVFHHGDCIGADADAHKLLQEYDDILIAIHPPKNPSKRARCSPFWRMSPPKDYLVRNHDMVDECELLIACPKTNEEELRSGTWATIRYADKIGKPVVILYPYEDDDVWPDQI